MTMYLVLSLLLLAGCAWLVVQPFLATRAVAVVVPAAAAPAAAAPVRATAPAQSSEELRASIEAAVAARKAAMLRKPCPSCGTTPDTGDAFCRSCGTRIEE